MVVTCGDCVEPSAVEARCWSAVMARRRTKRKMRKHMIHHAMITDTYTSSRRKSLPTANLMFDVDGPS